MPRTTPVLKDETFNFRVDPTLKNAFTQAAAADDRPAAQVLRDFMRAYVRQRERVAFEAEARRQSLAIAVRAAGPRTDEHAIMGKLDRYVDSAGFADRWKA